VFDIFGCHRNVIHAEHAKRALGKSYSFKLTIANARSVPERLVIRPKLPNPVLASDGQLSDCEITKELRIVLQILL
jgi:hypothetical protein